MRALILATGLALSLSACNSADVTEADNADMNNMAVDANMTMDPNMTANAGGMDGNMATNGEAEANLVNQDMNTNAPDANLANGL